MTGTSEGGSVTVTCSAKPIDFDKPTTTVNLTIVGVQGPSGRTRRKVFLGQDSPEMYRYVRNNTQPGLKVIIKIVYIPIDKEIDFCCGESPHESWEVL